MYVNNNNININNNNRLVPHCWSWHWTSRWMRFAGWCWAGTWFVTRAWVRHAPRETYHTCFPMVIRTARLWAIRKSTSFFAQSAIPKIVSEWKTCGMCKWIKHETNLSQVGTWRLAFPQVQIYLLPVLRKKHFWKEWTQIQILSSSRANLVLCFSFGGVEVRAPACQFDFFWKAFLGFNFLVGEFP